MVAVKRELAISEQLCAREQLLRPRIYLSPRETEHALKDESGRNSRVD